MFVKEFCIIGIGKFYSGFVKDYWVFVVITRFCCSVEELEIIYKGMRMVVF